MARSRRNLPNTQAAPAAPAAPQVIQASDHPSMTLAQAAFDAIIPRFTKAQEGIDDARTGLNQANDNSQGVRVTILCELATCAIEGDWSFEHAKMGIEAAIKAYGEAHNAQNNTLKQFASECYRAITPEAREHVQEAFAEADEAWDAEGETVEAARAQAKADGKAFKRDSVETPLRDTFKRKYHMVAGSNGVLAAYAATTPKGEPDDDRRLIASDHEMLAEAVSGSERANEKRAARAIAKAVETIEGIAVEFPSPRWDTVVRFLAGIDAKTLVAYRDTQRRQERMVQRERPAAAARQRPAASPAAIAAAVNDAADDLMAE